MGQTERWCWRLCQKTHSGCLKSSPSRAVLCLVFCFPPFCVSWAPQQTPGQPPGFMTRPFNELSVCWRNNRLELTCLLKLIRAADSSEDWTPDNSLVQEQSFFYCLDIWVPSGWVKIVLISGKITVFWIPKLRKQITNCLSPSESVWLPYTYLVTVIH